jgi:hypothetical protein
MAEAAEQYTPIDWTLEELVEYLALAPFGYEIEAAVDNIKRAISSGDLPLWDEEYVGGKLKRRYRLDPFYFRTHYTLKFDYIARVRKMRVVPQSLQWDDGILHFYLVIKQDVQRVWPRQSPQEPLKTKDWLKREIDRREELGDIPEEITEFSRQLNSSMKTALRAGVVKGVDRTPHY